MNEPTSKRTTHFTQERKVTSLFTELLNDPCTRIRFYQCCVCVSYTRLIFANRENFFGNDETKTTKRWSLVQSNQEMGQGWAAGGSKGGSVAGTVTHLVAELLDDSPERVLLKAGFYAVLDAGDHRQYDVELIAYQRHGKPAAVLRSAGDDVDEMSHLARGGERYCQKQIEKLKSWKVKKKIEPAQEKKREKKKQKRENKRENLKKGKQKRENKIKAKKKIKKIEKNGSRQKERESVKKKI